ncbi:hypothetical protein ACO0QE_004747 [Hanseniaspora vineae]
MLRNKRLKQLFKLSIGAGSVWIGYQLYQTTGNTQDNELSPNRFAKYKISWRKDIDESHYLMELTPVVTQTKNLWKEHGYDKLWSVEVKQPEIHVVRSYTPLPLIHSTSSEDPKEENFCLKVMEDGDNGGGKLMFYIKQYANGEVARWMHGLPENSVLELRGPFVEYELPEYPKDEVCRSRSFLNDNEILKPDVNEEKLRYEPFDINFFTGGTGIVTALQLMLTENPFRGRIHLFHGCNNTKELGPLLPLLNKLADAKRTHLNISTNARKDIGNHWTKLLGTPHPYRGIVPFSSATNTTILKPVLSLVVGPEGFVKTVSGEKFSMNQGPINGILGQKGWDNCNVFKLS